MPGEGARVSGSGSAAEVRFANSLPFFARGDGKEGRKEGVGRGRKKGVVGGEGWKRGSPSVYCTVVQEEEEARDGSKASPHFHSAAAAFVPKKGVDGDVASVVAVAAAVAAAFIWPRGMDGGGRVGRGMEQRRWK